MPLRAHEGLGPLHSDIRRPAGGLPGHFVDEVDLNGIGHLFQGTVLPPHMLRRVVWLECRPRLVPLASHSCLGGAITLRKAHKVKNIIGYC